MRKKIKCSLLLVYVLAMLLTHADAQQNNSIVIGSIDSINSQTLKEQRKIWVHVPASIRDHSAKKKYPVLYLLDADWNFSSVVGMADFLSSINGNNYCPEMIVVAIPNTDRGRDLTPTHVPPGGWIDSGFSKVSGGGEAFISFIEKELIPHIDSLYPTTHYRMLIGHSLGGLTVINTLVHHKNIFSSYVAIDPSMWWDKQKLLHETEQALKTDSYKGQAIFLGMANTMPPRMDSAAVQLDTTEGSIHPRSIIQLSRYLMSNPQNGLQAAYKYYNDDTHSSVPLITTYDALHFIFKDYRLDDYFGDATVRLDSFLTAHFANLSTKYGITSEDGKTLLPPEDVVINAGFQSVEKKHFRQAEDLYKMNIKNYPNRSRTYDFLGDLYVAKGDKANAIAAYRKSLSIQETSETRKKLAKLEEK